MKLYYLGMVRNDEAPAKELCSASDVTSFSYFQRSTVKEFLSMFAGTIAERTKPGAHSDVEEQAYTFHVFAHSTGVAGVMVTDHDYPPLVAHTLLSKVVDEFIVDFPKPKWDTEDLPLRFPKLDEYVEKYQDPQQADSIMKIQNELDETKIILHKTIESVLERGQKIDDLVQRSEGLSMQSKAFYKSAKKTNSCCVLM